jgi:hypothetical protein
VTPIRTARGTAQPGEWVGGVGAESGIRRSSGLQTGDISPRPPATSSSLVIARNASGRRHVGTRVVVIDAESSQVVVTSEERSGRAYPLVFVGRSRFYGLDDEAPANLRL